MHCNVVREWEWERDFRPKGQLDGIGKKCTHVCSWIEGDYLVKGGNWQFFTAFSSIDHFRTKRKIFLLNRKEEELSKGTERTESNFLSGLGRPMQTSHCKTQQHDTTTKFAAWLNECVSNFGVGFRKRIRSILHVLIETWCMCEI